MLIVTNIYKNAYKDYDGNISLMGNIFLAKAIRLYMLNCL